jgi:type I restriction enzyme S subunit
MVSRLQVVGWPTVRLDAVAQIRTGLAKGGERKPSGDRVAVPYLRVANVQAGALDLRVVKHIEVERADLDRYALHPGDVLMTEGGDFDKLGRSAIWAGEIEPCVHQNHVFAVRCDRTRVLPEWVSWVAGSSYGRQYFLLCSKQSTNLASINSTQLRALPLPLPTLAQQRAIAGTLRSLERQAWLVGQLRSSKAVLKRGLVQLLLTGQKRFAEFADSAWSSAPLGALVEAVSRRNSCGIRTVLSATGEHGLVDQRRYFNKSVAGADISGYYLLKRGEFAYNRSAMQGYPFGATKRLDDYPEGALSTLYLCFCIKDERLNSDFLVHLFESGMLERQLRRITRVGGRAHGLLNVTASDYLAITIPLPTFEEQRRISRVLNDCEREIGLLDRLQQQLEIQKRAIFARLLSGEIAVPA